MTEKEYFDKVYGCWLGKCVIGTLGAPYEGMKQLNNIKFEKRLIDSPLPNDDLDLQILWLSALMEYGVNTTSEHLAFEFFTKNISWPGEYAWFAKNYARKIRPPYCGIYENEFYKEGMGCPIRAEIWGLILPCNPALASQICVMDATLDHEGTSVYLEQFWSAMISMAFYCSDVRKIITDSKIYIPENTRARNMVDDVLEWTERYDDFLYIRSRIIAKYGHCDCTYALTNIAFTLLCLLMGENDVIKMGMMACNCGFDTDCTAGNAGALMGLILGAEKLMKDYPITDCGFILNLDYSRDDNTIYSLAKDTVKVGNHFLLNYKGAVNPIEGEIADTINPPPPSLIVTQVFYDQPPYIAPNETVSVKLTTFNHFDTTLNVTLYLNKPEFFELDVSSVSFVMPPHSSHDTIVSITCLPSSTLCETNIFDVETHAGNWRQLTQFGIIGKIPYTVYGPFWENNYTLDLGDNTRHYSELFPKANNENERRDVIRFYHLNTQTSPDKEYLKISDIMAGTTSNALYESEGHAYFHAGDKINISDFSSFLAPATYYLKRTIFFEQDTDLRVYIGHTDAFELYLNGELLAKRTNVENYTPENVHLVHVNFKKGENTLVYKLSKRSSDAQFSVTLLHQAEHSPQHYTTAINLIDKNTRD